MLECAFEGCKIGQWTSFAQDDFYPFSLTTEISRRHRCFTGRFHASVRIYRQNLLKAPG